MSHKCSPRDKWMGQAPLTGSTNGCSDSPCILDPECFQLVKTTIPVALGMLQLGRESRAGGRSGTSMRGSEVGTEHVQVCTQTGTLEPCLAKTSQSPLVSAISSLMGHLKSPGSKERKRSEGSPTKLMGTQSTKTKFYHSKLTPKPTHSRPAPINLFSASLQPLCPRLALTLLNSPAAHEAPC